MAPLYVPRGNAMTLCDYCDQPAVTISSAGMPHTRRAICRGHSAEIGLPRPNIPPRPENEWIRTFGGTLEQVTEKLWEAS